MSQPNHEDAADIYVPGAWRCLLCGFALQTATLFTRDGAVGHTLADVTHMSGESCPNDGTSMVRVTWQERANEHFAWGSQLMQEVLDATGAASLPAALAALKAPASPPPTPDVERLTWQPIATCPVGERVLIGGGGCPRVHENELRDFRSAGRAFAGLGDAEQPTHWMPLPDRPVAGDTPTPGGEQPR